MTRRRYILDESGQPVICDDLLTWHAWYEVFNHRVLQQTCMVARDRPEFMVSTIFLGMDFNIERPGNPPFLWQTAILRPPDGDVRETNHSTRRHAMTHHQQTVQLMRRLFSASIVISALPPTMKLLREVE